VFTKTFSATAEPACEHCGGRSLQRLISRVAVLHSSQDLYGDYDQTSWMNDLPDDGDDGGYEGEPSAPEIGSWDF
jgi:hypothetical protein